MISILMPSEATVPAHPAVRSLSVRNRKAARGRRAIPRDEGSALVETAFSYSIFLAMLFGIAQVSLGLYAYNYLGNVARQASRYAMVRGSTSCTNTPSLTNCNVTSAQIQTYIRGLGYAGITSSKLNATATWWTASATTPTTWSLCSSGTCNTPGNLVKVVVSYSLPVQIPFSAGRTLSLKSTSQMVISQ